MPHDLNGQKLNVGDQVSFTGTVTGITEGTDTCNITVRTPSGDGLTMKANDLVLSAVAGVEAEQPAGAPG